MRELAVAVGLETGAGSRRDAGSAASSGRRKTAPEPSPPSAGACPTQPSLPVLGRGFAMRRSPPLSSEREPAAARAALLVAGFGAGCGGKRVNGTAGGGVAAFAAWPAGGRG